MNTRTHKLVGKIFLQSAFMLGLFAAVSGVADASAIDENGHNEVSETLFESRAQRDVKRLLQPSGFVASEREAQLVEEVLHTTKHQYDDFHIRLDAKQFHASAWPLVSINVSTDAQGAQPTFRVGTEY